MSYPFGYPFFVSPPGKVRLQIEPEHFVRELLARWPGATVRLEPFPGEPTWIWGDVPIGDHMISFVFPDSHGVLLLENGDIADYAKLALWFRFIIPQEHELYLYDENAYRDVELRNDTTEQEIIAAMTSEEGLC